MLPRLRLPPSPAGLALLAAAFILPGLVGHDPWKTPDVISIEIAREMLRTGDWLVPRVAGVPLLDDAPLYYWIAALCGQLLGWVLPFHDAVRMASGLFVLATLVLLFDTARRWSDDEERPGTAAFAVLLLVGSLGLVIHAHEATPDVAALAASAGALAALARAPARPVASGAGFGAALGMACLSTGPYVPLALGAAALVLPAVCPEWQRRRSLVFFATAAVLAVIIAASWPGALALRAPDLFATWWSGVLRPRGEFVATLRHYLGIASWFGWPVLPLAAWAAWRMRRRWREPRIIAPLAASLAVLVGIAYAGPAQDANATVLLAPLTLLAAQAVTRLPRGAVAAFDWFAVMTFTFFAALVWLGYVAMSAGVPAQIAHNFAKLAPGFAARVAPLPFAVAALLSAAWIVLALRAVPSPARAVTRWAAGVTLLWATVATLWLPWIDHQRSYEAVSLQLKSLVPSGTPCVFGSAIGTPQRAALDYHAQLRVVPYDPAAAPAGSLACPLLLVQGSPAHEFDRPDARWRKVADVGRPGDKLERYRLYRIEQ